MKKVHYAWIVCALGTLIIICNYGLPANIFPYILPYLQDKGFSGAECSSLLTVRCLFTAIGMFWFHRFHRIFGLRKGVAAASIAIALSFAMYALFFSYAVYMAASALMGLGFGVGTLIPVTLIVNNWFNTNSGAALGICAAGSGICAIIFPPVVSIIVQNFGLAASFWLMGLTTAVSAALTWLFIRDTPEEMGLEPFGGCEEQQDADDPRSDKRKVKGDSKLLIAAMLAACALMGGVGMAAPGHYSVLFSHEGITMGAIAIGLSVTGVTLTVGKFCFGIMDDRIGTYRTTQIFLTVLIAGLICCCVTNGRDGIMYLAMVLMGFGFPPASVGISLWSLDFSGGLSEETAVEHFQLALNAGGMIFTLIPGVLFDHTGSYRVSYIMFVVMTLFVFAIVTYAYKRHSK